MSQKTQTAQLPLPPALKILRAAFPIIQAIFPPLAKKIGVAYFLKPFKFSLPEKEKACAAKAIATCFYAARQTVWQYNWGTDKKFVLLVHGWSGRAMQFYAIIERLQAHNISVIAFDAPAHGKSTGHETNIIEFSKCIDHIVRENGKPIAIIGHSLGGIAAMYYQRDYRTQIPQITISSPAIVSEIFENYAFRLNANPQKVEKWIREHTLRKLDRDFNTVSGQVLAKGFPKVPFLICLDEEDREISMKNVEVMRENMPFAEVLITKGYGHVRILRSEEILNRVEAFVKAI